MKMSLFMLLLTPCVCLGAGEAQTLLPEGSRASGDVEERRAELVGKRFAEFRTLAGRVYRDVKITKIGDGGISLTHADGAARLGFGDLSPAQRRHFGITAEDAAAVYVRETLAREAYEKEVAEREKIRREIAAKEAAERAETQRLAAEKAEAARAIALAAKPAETIPLYPTIKRVDSGILRSGRSSGHGYYYGSYGYCHPVRHRYIPAFRYTGSVCRPAYGTGIHFSIR